jgi:hypothetical protein
MITLISAENIQQINTVATALMAHLKSTKFFFVSSYPDARVKASGSLIELSRALDDDHTHRMNSVKTANNIDLQTLITQVNTLADLLNNKQQNMCHKLKDYSGDIKVKLCRELVGDLEDMLIEGDITFTDIEDVYATLGKPVAKKYQPAHLNAQGQSVYRAIQRAIKDKAQPIKARSIQHYIDMVNLVDPRGEITTKKAFVKACRKKFSDMNTLMLCVASRFDSDKLQDMITTAFEQLVVTAACKIIEHVHSTNDAPSVEINSLHVGGKGFDFVAIVDGQYLDARAVPVEGCYVRFHYRYIIT